MGQSTAFVAGMLHHFCLKVAPVLFHLKGTARVRGRSHSKRRKITWQLDLYHNMLTYKLLGSFFVLLVLLFWNLGAKAVMLTEGVAVKTDI